MASKLYKAVDKLDGKMSGFLVNERGVSVADWLCSDSEEVRQWRVVEAMVIYSDISRFDDAIDPVLIVEW